MRKPINRSRAIAITEEEGVMRGVLLWLLGIPIPIIILLYVFHVVLRRRPPPRRSDPGDPRRGVPSVARTRPRRDAGGPAPQLQTGLFRETNFGLVSPSGFEPETY